MDWFVVMLCRSGAMIAEAAYYDDDCDDTTGQQYSSNN